MKQLFTTIAVSGNLGSMGGLQALRQNFLGLLHDPEFFKLGKSLQGYDVQLSGRMLFPKNNVNKETNRLSKNERSE